MWLQKSSSKLFTMIKKELIVPGMVYERKGYNDVRTVLSVTSEGRVYYGNKRKPYGSNTMNNAIENMIEDGHYGGRDFSLITPADGVTAINYSVF